MSIDPSQTREMLSEAVGAAMKSSSLSRKEISRHLTETVVAAGVGKRVSVTMLEKYASPASVNSIPSYLLPLLCETVGSTEPLAALVEPLGLSLAGPRERELMRLGQAQVDAKQAAKAKRMAEAALEDL